MSALGKDAAETVTTQVLGDSMYNIMVYLKYFKKNKTKPFKKTFKVFRFAYEQINTFSDMEKCNLDITDDELIFRESDIYNMKDIANIELVDTILKESNKGIVIKLTLYNQMIICLSLGYPSFFTIEAFTRSSNTLVLYNLIHDKWEQATEKLIAKP